MKQSKTTTIFDIDGPLRGGKSTAWMDYLAERGLFSKKTLKEINLLLKELRNGKVSYLQFSRKMFALNAAGLKGKSVVLVRQAIGNFMKTKELALHSYSKELVAMMNRRGPTIAITANPSFFAEALLAVLPFHITFGSEFPAKEGKFSGEMGRNMALSREQVIIELKKHPEIWHSNSIAIADMTTDARMMRHARTKIALNPDQKMAQLAKKKGWKTVQGKRILTVLRRLK